MQGSHQYSFRTLANQDKNEVTKLLFDTFKMQNEFWLWKYELNPDYDQSLIVVALNAQKVVGIAHWLPRTIKASSSITIRASLGADLAVDADHKGHGIGAILVSFQNKILEEKNMAMSYGFIEPDLFKHIHSRQIGLVHVPTSTVVYRKYLDVSRVKEKASLLNERAKSDEKMREKLANLNVRVLFRLRGMPLFMVKLGPESVCVEEHELPEPDLKIRADPTLLASVVKSRRKTLELIKNILLRKMEIRPTGLRGVLKLYATLKLVQGLFASR